MKAVVKPNYGAGIELREMSVPKCSEEEVLVKVEAASICGSDLHMYEGSPAYHWINVPLVLGHEFAGTVVEVGNPEFKVLFGKKVVINPYVACGKCNTCRDGKPNLCDGRGSSIRKVPAESLRYGFRENGGMAEYAAVNRENVIVLPAEFPIDIAGMLEAIGIGVHAVERSDIKVGDSAVVIGPGPIGLALVAILANYGLKRLIVTGLIADRQRMQLARELGATDIVYADETQDAEAVESITSGSGVDFVFESSGFSGALTSAIRMLRKGGELLLVGISGKDSTVPTNEIVRGELTVKGVYGVTPKTMERAISMVASGKFDFSKLISHVIPLEHAVEGFEYGLKRHGSKVILKP